MDRVALIATIAFFLAAIVGQSIVAILTKVSFKTNAFDPGAAKLYRTLGAMFMAFYTVQAGKSFGGVPDLVRQEGLVLMLMGFALIIWAQLSLGGNWVGGVGLHNDHTLVTRGPYQWVRHPIYSGYCLGAIGVALASVNPFAALGMTWVVLALIIRIPHEQVLMRQRFGKQYEEYCNRAGMLVPHLRGIR